MLSLETGVRITGDPVLADRLETISFNALPAALANNIKGLQYYTVPNNVIAINGGHGFNQDYPNGTLPGPNSGYPCCRSNFHMGWPKLAQNSWAETADGGLALVAYVPTVVTAIAGGKPVQITEDTGYPFEEQVRLQLSVSNATFPLVLRIPGWCSNATITVNGQPQAGVEGRFIFSHPTHLEKWRSSGYQSADAHSNACGAESGGGHQSRAARLLAAHR